MISKQAAGLVAEKGYTNVKWFRDGIAGWVQAGYPLETGKALPKVEITSLTAAALQPLLDNVAVLDIRTEALHATGSIQGSLKIPLELLSTRSNEIPKGKKLVVVDHAGQQAITGARFLKNQGFEDVCWLQGGVMAWIGQGLPLDK